MCPVKKKFQLVCSTGVSCEEYKDEEWPLNNAVVVNSFFGIGLTNGSFNSIVSKAVDRCSSKLENLKLIF